MEDAYAMLFYLEANKVQNVYFDQCTFYGNTYYAFNETWSELNILSKINVPLITMLKQTNVYFTSITVKDIHHGDTGAFLAMTDSTATISKSTFSCKFFIYLNI